MGQLHVLRQAVSTEVALKLSQIPIIDIAKTGDGLRLRVLRRHNDSIFEAPADVEGAADIGEWLHRHSVDRWFYCSIVDFPVDAGAPDLDFRFLIRNGYRKALEGQSNHSSG